MENDVITQTEAAKLLGVSRARVEQMVDAGLLHPIDMPVMVRAVSRTEVLALAQRERKPGRPRKTAPVAAEGAGDAVRRGG